MNRNKIYLALLLIASLLTGCATTGDDDLTDEDADKSALMLYQEAKESLDAGDYETAVERYEALEARFPFGRFAQQAQIDIAYAYYKYEEPDSAVAAADRFIKLYPRHSHVDYAYYLRGLIRFDQGRGFFDKFDSQDPAKRDPGAAKQSFQYFSQLVKQYPDSIYTKDALLRMRYLRNSLARHEIYVARFYIKREAYLAAANRAKYVIEYYQRTPSMPDALAVMVEAYRKLNLPELADDALRVFEYNYPKHALLAKLRGSTPIDDESLL